MWSQWAGVAGVQGGLRAPGAISHAAGAGHILTQLAVVLSDGLWAGEENWSVELECETSVVLGATGQAAREGLLRRRLERVNWRLSHRLRA